MGDKKTKILMLSDHPLSSSGVGVQARYLTHGLIETGKYSFRCLGGAVKHDNYDTVKVNDDLIIKPTDGFGNPNLLRMLLAVERPDILLLFTDPRFFHWVWEMEDEVHQICPIAYNHLWDNDPYPQFNSVLYESTDLINCINWPTYKMLHERFPEKVNYVPHAVPENVFFPLPVDDRVKLKTKLLGKERADHFVVLFVGRNARRKVPSDIVYAFKMFIDDLYTTQGHRNATLLMHCDPLDPEGTNLHQVIEMLGVQNNVVFSNERTGFAEVNVLYNISDTLINASLNEGFGLPVLEMKMAGKPVIAIKTGGLTRQVQDHETNVQYGVAMDPDVRMMTGNHTCPYIFEDAVSHQTMMNAMKKIYDLGTEGRSSLGASAREHALKNYDMKKLIADWDTSLTKLTTAWREGKRPARWEKVEL